MTVLDSIPALLRLAVVFVILLIAIRKKFSLGNAFVIGSLLLGLLFGMSPVRIGAAAGAAVADPKSLSLALVVGLILLLSSTMEAAGQMKRLLKAFRGVIRSPKLNLMVFPALIGLLPMPGGAVFSAPMVKELGQGSGLAAEHLSYINYWFRHIWEYWWPMYPGVLLATLMADINLAVFIVCLLPLTAAAVYLGWRPLGTVDSLNLQTTAGQPASRATFFIELTPILIVIVPGIGLGVFFSVIFENIDFAKEAGLILSLCTAIGWIWVRQHLTASEVGRMMKNPQMANMIYMVFAILVFKGILTGSGAVGSIADELTRLRIPLFLIVAFLPLIVGTITGITIAFVGSTFPIIVPLIQTGGQSEFMLAYVMLALVFGFAGVLMSPLHLCLVLSNGYFKADAGRVYRLLGWPCAGLLFASMGYFWLLKFAI